MLRLTLKTLAILLICKRDKPKLGMRIAWRLDVVALQQPLHTACYSLARVDNVDIFASQSLGNSAAQKGIVRAAKNNLIYTLTPELSDNSLHSPTGLVGMLQILLDKLYKALARHLHNLNI